MNLMQLLQLLNPDLAEWERQRRIRAMGSKFDQYMDGPQLNTGGVYYDAVPQNSFNNPRTVSTPGLGHLLMPWSPAMNEPLPPIRSGVKPSPRERQI